MDRVNQEWVGDVRGIVMCVVRWIRNRRARKNCRKGERATANVKMRRQTEKIKRAIICMRTAVIAHGGGGEAIQDR